nr:NADH dehydrogenase subunit 6 [Travisia sanrikuensis]
MTLLILTACSISFASTMLLIFSPLLMGLWILLISVTFSMIISFSINSWFGLIFFLIYIGGLLVMFAYFVALTPNQQFSLMAPTLFFILSSLAIIFIFFNNFNFNNMNLDYINSLPQLLIYSSSNAPILIILALLLFLALITVVKIASRNGGPLRPYN